RLRGAAASRASARDRARSRARGRADTTREQAPIRARRSKRTPPAERSVPFDEKHDHAQNRGMAAEALIPTSPDEAAGLFGEGDDLTVFGGGTILLPEIAAGRLKPTRALMLHRSGLDSLDTAGDVVRIGAMTPMARCAGTRPSAATSAPRPESDRSAATSALR